MEYLIDNFCLYWMSILHVENFHSRIRARTNTYDDGVKVQEKAKLIDAERVILQELNSYFAPPAQYLLLPC